MTSNPEDVNLFEEAALRKAVPGSGKDIKGARSDVDPENIFGVNRRNKQLIY